MNNPDHIYESLETIFGLKFLNSLMRIRHQGWKNSDPGSGIPKNIPDPQHYRYCILISGSFSHGIRSKSVKATRTKFIYFAGVIETK